MRVDPAAEPRFLVLNELYHPAWRAWADGQPTQIYPTNVVMRGIVVAPGVATIELRYRPFIVTPTGLGLVAGGLLLSALIWWALRRFVASHVTR